MANVDRLASARQFLRSEFLRNDGLALIAHAPVAIYVTDLEGIIVTANDYAAEIEHLPDAERLAERPLKEFLDAETVQRMMRSAQAGQLVKYFKDNRWTQCRLCHENHIIWAVSVVGSAGSSS